MEKQVVEYAGVPVGITVPEGGQLKFIAVKFPVIELDGTLFHSIEDLRRAIHQHLSSGNTLAHMFERDGAASAAGNDRARSVA